ncbi:substrate-binding periplasmic protein [Paraglaciecola arctica]|uniref:substrate-binding periplasmic protein n=1 Tax=Paraglaciecola arctica TaxID=1128911 RepID=UPI001C071F46|nr:transporter substrate-binding domain-containing protein [Paraglaciecola arctica]MBU3003829.1 transporter substrate-binding domain-containing protein [Paraglaciecola arctica]
MKPLFLFLYISILCVSKVKAADLSVGWELWYPYQYHNEKHQLVGLDIDSFNAIMAEAKLSFSAAEVPWNTHLNFLKSGKMDVAMGASWSKEREDYAYFSKPYRKETVNLFVRKGNAKNIHLETLSDLAGSKYVVGVESGYYYGEDYAELIKTTKFKNNIHEVVDLEENVTFLMQGHLDGFLVDPNTMQSFVKKYRMQGEFEAHPLTIYSTDIFIMLSKKSSDISTLNRINQAITTLTENGELSRISDSWRTLQSED